MNANPLATTILCYGDSNTYGLKPDWVNRHAADVRWTGVLQKLLGNSYYIIEEGLSGRTTDADYADRPGHNGKTYLGPCLDSHGPLDMVILMLGTNDLKLEFNRSAQQIAEALRGLVNLVHAKAKSGQYDSPEILLVSPVLVDEAAANFSKNVGCFDHESALKSQQLALAIKTVADETGCRFVDAAEVAVTDEDGLHLDAASHRGLGELLAQEVSALTSVRNKISRA